MGGYAHDFIGTTQKSGHVKTVSDEIDEQTDELQEDSKDKKPEEEKK